MIKQLLKAAFRPHITHMVAKVYIPTLFPLTFLICLTALWLDGFLGFKNGFIEEPFHLWAAGASFILGLFLWILTYEQLTRIGEGSPSPAAGRTVKLVRSGIYAYSRNPSLFGKLLGFISVGLALNSISFCFILAPLLLMGSLIEKVVRQEPQLIEIFGDEYKIYQQEVPLFIPWKLLKRTK